MLNETIKKMFMLFTGLIFFSVVLWFVFQRGENIKRDFSPTPTSEYAKIMEIESKLVAKIRENIKVQKNKINSRNCKGFLYDEDRDGNYDNKIIDNTMESFKLDLIVKYNFCSYNKTEKNKFMQKREGEEFAPIFIINADKSTHSGKKGLLEPHIILEGI